MFKKNGDVLVYFRGVHRDVVITPKALTLVTSGKLLYKWEIADSWKTPSLVQCTSNFDCSQMLLNEHERWVWQWRQSHNLFDIFCVVTCGNGEQARVGDTVLITSSAAEFKRPQAKIYGGRGMKKYLGKEVEVVSIKLNLYNSYVNTSCYLITKDINDGTEHSIHPDTITSVITRTSRPQLDNPSPAQRITPVAEPRNPPTQMSPRRQPVTQPADANGERLNHLDVVLISNPRQIPIGQNGWTNTMQGHVGHYARVCTSRDIARYDDTGIIPVYCLINRTSIFDRCCSMTLMKFDVCSDAVLRIPQGTTHAQRPYYRKSWLAWHVTHAIIITYTEFWGLSQFSILKISPTNTYRRFTDRIRPVNIVDTYMLCSIMSSVTWNQCVMLSNGNFVRRGSRSEQSGHQTSASGPSFG